jgi:hypothetical protein
LVVFVAKRELLGKYYLRNTTSWGYMYKILPFKTPAFRSFISLSAGGASRRGANTTDITENLVTYSRMRKQNIL